MRVRRKLESSTDVARWASGPSTFVGAAQHGQEKRAKAPKRWTPATVARAIPTARRSRVAARRCVSSPRNKINNLRDNGDSGVFFLACSQKKRIIKLSRKQKLRKDKRKERGEALVDQRDKKKQRFQEARSAIDGQGVVVAVLFVACCVCACQISLPTRFLKDTRLVH